MNMREGNGREPATRAQLEEVRAELKGEMGGIEGRMGNLEGEMKSFRAAVATHIIKSGNSIEKKLDDFRAENKAQLERLYGAVIKASSQGKTFGDKAESHKDILIAHETALRDHGRRIPALESSE